MRSTLPLVLLALVLGVSACGGDGDDDAAASETGAATTAAATTVDTAPARPAGTCEEVEAPEPKPDGGAEAPTDELDDGTTYRLVVDTNCGSFTITLDPEGAPETASSLVALARDGFFDGTVFHRVVPGFVIQGGDPTGTGTGGPGYQTVDPPPADAAYTEGVVAMAKAGFEAAGTAGSQFFVVTAADAGLTPDFAIVGRVTEGMETVRAIDELGLSDGPPSLPVVISRVTVEEG